MNNVFSHIWRFVGLVAAQGFLFQAIAVKVGAYFNIILWPIFILLLPLQMAVPYLVALGCLAGFMVDFFYGTPGLHASAGAFTGFIRPWVILAFAPKGGFTAKELIFSPAHVSWPTFLQGAAGLLVLHLFWYFSVEAFTFVYLSTITLKTLSAWVLSFGVTILYAILFNPKK